VHLADTSKPTQNTFFFPLKYCFDPIVIIAAENYISEKHLSYLKEVTMIAQERANSSPIWYTP